jgi:hypothetical protein
MSALPPLANEKADIGEAKATFPKCQKKIRLSIRLQQLLDPGTIRAAASPALAPCVANFWSARD